MSYKRLRNSLERFMQFVQTQRTFKIIDQDNVDALYNLQSKQFSSEPSAKGIETNTLELVQALFIAQPAVAHAVEDVVEQVGISKTTARRYLGIASPPSSCGWRCCTAISAIRGGCTARPEAAIWLSYSGDNMTLDDIPSISAPVVKTDEILMTFARPLVGFLYPNGRRGAKISLRHTVLFSQNQTIMPNNGRQF